MIKFIIAKGIGFNPGSIKFIVTHGFAAGLEKIIFDSGTYSYQGYPIGITVNQEARWADLPGTPGGPWQNLGVISGAWSDL